MSETKRELYKTIDILPENLLNELLNYVKELASKNIANGLPNDVVINDNEDLEKKLNERIKKIENGEAKFFTIDEAFEEIDKI